MKITLRTIFALVVLFSTSLHIAINFLNLIPTNPLSSVYKNLTTKAHLGIFVQKWILFAPEPPTSTWRVEYRCKKSPKSDWTNWEDPAVPLLAKHHQYRVSHHHYLVRLYRGHMRALHNQRQDIVEAKQCSSQDQKCGAELKNKIKSAPRFPIVAKMMRNLCRQKTGSIKNAVHFRYKLLQVVKYSQKNSSKITLKPDFQHYPIIHPAENFGVKS